MPPEEKRGSSASPPAFAACFFLLSVCVRGLSLNDAVEDVQDQTDLLLQAHDTSGNSSQISKELRKIVFVIQSQRNSFHLKKADELKQNILKQAEALGKAQTMLDWTDKTDPNKSIILGKLETVDYVRRRLGDN